MLQNILVSSINSLSVLLFCIQQFMKFVKRLGDGDLTIKDNEVIEKGVQEKSEDWVNEFVQKNQENPQVMKAETFALFCVLNVWLFLLGWHSFL